MTMELIKIRSEIQKGGHPKYHEKLSESHKLFARKRIELLCDNDSFVEDAIFANCIKGDLPADGVITGFGKIHGRSVAVMANDSTVKAGSWGARTVEKILRLQEKASELEVPVFYLVDSAGARITDQVEMFPGRRGAGRIFYYQSILSGRVPQLCLLFGPSAAGGAYIPAFCDILIMVDKNASMYLGSPRMAESVIGEKVTLEEMGGARMHCQTSGCGDILVSNEEEAISQAKEYLNFMPNSYRTPLTITTPQPPQKPEANLKSSLPDSPSRVYDMKNVLSHVIDSGSFFEIKELYAPEIITAFARLDGAPIGIVANQPRVKGGVLFAESANKAARFISLCSSFGIPLLFVADVPGFMVGSKVEKEGIIRAGAKMIHAVSNAPVPKISLIVRKAYGAGLYAMCGGAFGSDAVLALPSAKIAVMGPEPAVSAVYYNQMQAMEENERAQFVREKVEAYEREVDILKLASELIVDDIIGFEAVRSTLIHRFSLYQNKYCPGSQPLHRPILPM